MKLKGYIQVYTGNGKGKTTAALGLALRAAGRNKKTAIIQFMKKGEYGEHISIDKYLKHKITIKQFGLPNFHTSGQTVSKKEKEAAMEGVTAAKKILKSNEYDILILDEVCVLLYFKIIDIKEILNIMDHKPSGMELILTGRYAPKEIIEKADLVTEMQEIKHYYQQKVPARLGIEK